MGRSEPKIAAAILVHERPPVVGQRTLPAGLPVERGSGFSGAEPESSPAVLEKRVRRNGRSAGANRPRLKCVNPPVRRSSRLIPRRCRPRDLRTGLRISSRRDRRRDCREFRDDRADIERNLRSAGQSGSSPTIVGSNPHHPRRGRGRSRGYWRRSGRVGQPDRAATRRIAGWPARSGRRHLLWCPPTGCRRDPEPGTGPQSRAQAVPVRRMVPKNRTRSGRRIEHLQAVRLAEPHPPSSPAKIALVSAPRRSAVGAAQRLRKAPATGSKKFRPPSVVASQRFPARSCAMARDAQSAMDSGHPGCNA